MSIVPSKITGDPVVDSWSKQVTDEINRLDTVVQTIGLTHLLTGNTTNSASVRLPLGGTFLALVTWDDTVVLTPSITAVNQMIVTFSTPPTTDTTAQFYGFENIHGVNDKFIGTLTGRVPANAGSVDLIQIAGTAASGISNIRIRDVWQQLH